MLVKVGDSANLQPLSLACNTGDEGLFSNIRSSTRRGLTAVRPCKESPQVALICGGGPSLGGSLENIRQLQVEGAKIYALNNSAKFLTDHGIEVDAQIIVDSRPLNAQFVAHRTASELYLASQCHPETYAQALKSGYRVKVYHGAINGILPNIHKSLWQTALWALYKRFRRPWLANLSRVPELIGGGTTVGLTGLCLVHTLGHRKIHLFGYDSSHAEGKSHAYRQDANSGDEIVQCVVDSKVFDCSTTMAGQSSQFKDISEMLASHGAKIEVHGEGLLPTIWRAWEREKTQKILNAVYDLGLSPPTYDFLAFLIEAERYRVREKFDRMDVYFQPGPMHGFRHDELPPDVETRKAMLWRVCAGIARLMPSVRHVCTLGERMHVQGHVFPVDYAENSPKSHYGIGYLKGARPMLKASESARRHIALRFTKPYATISLRTSTYWPERNSNLDAWRNVAVWLKTQGIAPVVVPDTEGTGLEGFPAFELGAFDVDLRAALYEGALINLGVSNGPMALLPYLKARYLMFNVGVAKTHSASIEFLNSHGYYRGGDGMGGNGRMIWEPDTEEAILRELREFEVRQPEKTSCQE